jgi:lipopolysaccharide heptosyltransferase II
MFMNIQSDNVKKILVVNVNWLGDVVFSTPVFTALHDFFPQAQISCLAVPRVREVLECVPSLHEIIEYDEKGRHRSLWAKWQLARQLKAKHFDLAFLLRPSRSRALLLSWAGIPQRIGYGKEGRWRFLTQVVAESDGLSHRGDYYLKVIEAAGVPATKRLVSLKVPASFLNEADALLASHGLRPGDEFIVINPGGNWDLKRWPALRYAALAGALLEQGRRVVFTGAPGDQQLVQEIIRALSGRSPIDLSGATNLKQLLAVLKKARLVISGDSGPLHLAAAVGTKTIALFGPTRPEVTAPRGKGRSWIIQKEIGCNGLPCYYLDCPNNQCMQAITVKDVLDAVQHSEH